METLTGETRKRRVTKLFTFYGVERREINEAVAGDIVMVAGIPDIFIGETIFAMYKGIYG